MPNDSQLRGDPNGDPLAIVLYRLAQIESRLDRVMSTELYTARHEALQARVAELEREQDEQARSTRQVIVGVVLAILTAIIGAGVAVL